MTAHDARSHAQSIAGGADRTPRICMPTWRNFKKVAWQGGLYEAQDVLTEIDSVDLLRLEARPWLNVRERWQRRLVWHDVSRQIIKINPGLRPVRLRREYDLFVAVCESWWDVLYIPAIKGWKDHCRTSVCYLDELWATNVPRSRYWLQALAQFDHVCLGLRGTVDAMSQALGRRCHWVPGGVDTLRFSPYPTPPARVVDIYSIGRRWEGVHRVLSKLSGRGQLFYIHDTFKGADVDVPDHRQHRDLLANIAKRSRFFIVAPAKMDVPSERDGQQEVGYRYFEGCAAGAVMIGQAPNCESYRELFDWPDAVIEVQTDGSDVESLLARLAADPERLEAISRRNAAQALLRHDWTYRWDQILAIAGLRPMPALEQRERHLRALAELAAEPMRVGSRSILAQ